jgi:hypothetical protein
MYTVCIFGVITIHLLEVLMYDNDKKGWPVLRILVFVAKLFSKLFPIYIPTITM